METILQHIRYSVRSLIKTPAFTAVAIVVLALAIGANTAIFTVVNAVLIRALPYPNSDRLVMLWETNPRFQIGIDTLPVTPGTFMDWREQSSVFEHISALGAGRLNLSGSGEPERISGATVSANFFRLMGIEPKLGRAFQDDEEKPGATKVAVISHALWQRRFGGAEDIVGKPMTLDGESYTVIGVAPEGFQFPRARELPYFVGVSSATELWRPMIQSEDFISKKRANHQMTVIAKLKPGVTREQAQAEMTAIASRLEQAYPENQGIGAKVVPLSEQVVGNSRIALLVLMGAVGLVLLIACANVANLMLTRASGRRKEIAIRIALGASRRDVIRQLMSEALLLSLASAVAGTLLSLWGVKAMLALTGKNLPRLNEVTVDPTVLGFTVAIALLTSLFFGLTPALQASKINLVQTLKDGSRGQSGGRGANRVRGALVVAEVALSLVLLIGAALMIKSLAQLLEVDPGFKTDRALTMNIALLGSKYPSANQQIGFFDEVRRRVEVLPGIESVGLISSAPLSGGVYAGGFSIEGRGPRSANEDLSADRRMISPEYFNALQIALIKGRYFTERDNQASTGVAIVSDSWARRFVPDDDPIGKRIKLGGRDSTRPWLSIVGIAGDVRDTALESDARPCVYLPYSQFPASSMSLVVRTAVDSRAESKTLVPAIRSEVWAIDKDQPVTDVKTMDEYVSDSVSPRRANALLLAVFAALALALASIGVYGVMAYSVAQRVREIGIRMALGAQRSDVVRLIVGSAMTLVFAGVGIGLASALALSRVLSSLLYGVSATDPMTFAFVSVLLVCLAWFASYIPARRATKVDPMIALRHE
ncbi:MAG TPA: ABC transporter permease [Blastocatellia bacterium]|nr:ABC transporter permease [Blastocatellia bacterium]